MTEKYKLEKWRIVKWKNTKREEISTVEKLVKRDSKGHFAKNHPLITEIKEKTYGSGVYKIGIINGKIVIRQKIAGKETPQWQTAKQQKLKNATMFRCSLALNDIPFRGSEYYGFRIVAFSRRKEVLTSIYPHKMYNKLIDFIEKCLHYKEANFTWFEHALNYCGKIPPEPSNASLSDNNRYELLWTKRKTGSIMRHEIHMIGEL